MTIAISKQNGFTLLELIITMVILGILALLSAPYALNLFTGSQVDNAATQVMEGLQRAQSFTLGQRDRGVYSLRFENDRFIFFPGHSYNANHLENETVLMPEGVTLSWSLNGGGNSVFFQPGNGRTQQYGTITITADTGEVMIVVLEQSGLIYLQY